MAVAVEMPKLGNTVEECLLARWARHPGERIAAGELLAEIETDKATFEVVAPAGGTLLAAFFQEGDLVPVFKNICVIGDPGEPFEHFRPTVERAATPAAGSPEPAQPAGPAGHGSGGPPHGALSPRARRYAAGHALPTENVAGSGPGGRVLEADLKAVRTSPLARKYLADGYELRGAARGTVLARDLSPPPLPVAGVREKIARRMREALAASAQYTLHSSADATGLLALRARIKQAPPGVPDININDMVMFCAVRALGRMPELNVTFAGGKVHRNAHVHLGFACDTPRGLLVPVVHEADTLSLEELSQRVKLLTAQAVEGTIGPDDLAGATFSVSNLGSLGIESFTPVLVPPQVALLGVNTIEPRPVRRDGRIEFVDRIGLSLTCDHQWIDGAPGARFLKLLRQEIEQIENVYLA